MNHAQSPLIDGPHSAWLDAEGRLDGDALKAEPSRGHVRRFSNNQTVGAGMLHFALRRSQNIHWQALEVDKAARGRLNGH